MELPPEIAAELEPALIPFAMRTGLARMEMQDPVLAEDGNTYERAAIEQHIRQHGTSPIVPGQKLSVDRLIVNNAILVQIQEFRDQTEAREWVEADGGSSPTEGGRSLSERLFEADAMQEAGQLDAARDAFGELLMEQKELLASEADPQHKAAIASKTQVLAQRLATVEAAEAAAAVGAGVSMDGAGGVDSPRGLARLGRSSTNDFARSVSTTSVDMSSPPPLSPAREQLFTSDGLSLDTLLERCAPHNSEGEGELQPVRGLSMWLRYEAGQRKGMWREVWPFRDEESGFNRRFFRALEVRAVMLYECSQREGGSVISC